MLSIPPFGIPPVFPPFNSIRDYFPRCIVTEERPSDAEEAEEAETGVLEKPPPSLRMLQPVYQQILEALTERPPEYGGLLLGPSCSDVVTHFIPDETGKQHQHRFNSMLRD